MNGGPNVLVARLDSLGDVLLAGPAVRAVAAGAREVTLMSGPRGRAAAELLPGVDRVVEFAAPWIDPEPQAVERERVLAAADDLAKLRIDRAIVLTSFHQSALPTAFLLRLAGVPLIAAISEEYPGSLLDVRHRLDDDVHEVERGLSLVAAAGFALPDGDDAALRVRLPANAPVHPFEGEPYVVVHPGTSVPARAWDPARHAELVEELVRGGRHVAVTGSEHERALTAFVCSAATPGVVDLGGRLSFGELGHLLAGADAVIVGNTGPAHLAAAVGTPVVSLYAPTVPAVRWSPWRVPHVLLGRQDAPCANTRVTVCPFEGHPCLNEVTVRDVIGAVESLAPQGDGEQHEAVA